MHRHVLAIASLALGALAPANAGEIGERADFFVSAATILSESASIGFMCTGQEPTGAGETGMVSLEVTALDGSTVARIVHAWSGGRGPAVGLSAWGNRRTIAQHTEVQEGPDPVRDWTFVRILRPWQDGYTLRAASASWGDGYTCMPTVDGDGPGPGEARELRVHEEDPARAWRIDPWATESGAGVSFSSGFGLAVDAASATVLGVAKRTSAGSATGFLAADAGSLAISAPDGTMAGSEGAPAAVAYSSDAAGDWRFSATASASSSWSGWAWLLSPTYGTST